MKNKNKPLPQVFHYDLFGKREEKYDFLKEKSLNSIDWEMLNPAEPTFFLVEKDFKSQKTFNKGINLRDLFPNNSMGIATGKDSELVSFEINILHNNYSKVPIKFYYRPFDIRFTIFDNDILQRARFKLMSNYLKKNIGLNIVRQSKQKGIETLVNVNISNRDLITNHTYNFPLYLYPEATPPDIPKGEEEDSLPVEGLGEVRVPNLNPEIVNQIAERLGLTFVAEKEHTPTPSQEGSFAPIDILDYIYAVLHSPSYREKYKEFLKIDFPRVPYPKTPSPSERAGGEVFWQLVKLGGEIRQIHLLESPVVENYITQYPIDGDNVVEKPKYERTPLAPPDIPKGEEEDSPPVEGLGEVIKAARKPGYITANPAHYRLIKEIRDELKDNPTEAEKLIWEYLRNNNTGHKIRRQHVIDDFITDFVCLRKKVVIEIDGKIHLKQKDYDELRTSKLSELGYEVVRFKNDEVFADPQMVADKIKAILDSKKDMKIEVTTPPDLPKGEEEDSPPLEGLGEVVGRVYINDTQYFANVPQVVWEFYIGGYQPAQKWLKDRKGRALEFEDILHYQKIIVALVETDRLMKEIDKIGVE